MLKILLTMVSLLVAGASYANCEYKTDWRTGNRYQICSNSSGTTINGSNYNTGSRWKINQNNDGTYSGHDSDNNYFRGNNNTGSYYNYGTGRMCTGTGYSRVCTGGD